MVLWLQKPLKLLVLLPVQTRLAKWESCLVYRSPACTGKAAPCEESCLLEMTSLVGDIPDAGWACVAL